jgi:hypothetical protein
MHGKRSSAEESVIASGIGLPEDVLNAAGVYTNVLYARVLMSLIDLNQKVTESASGYGMPACLRVLQGWQEIYILLKTRDRESNSGISIN